MTSIQLRKKVTHFIEEKADDTLLKMIYALMKTYSEEKQNDLELSPEQWAEVDRRRNEMRSGKAKTITHPELMKSLKAKLNRIKK
ncbi:MAG: addiction module protein [Bacteroidetes bacterium]|jgi:hypothetical protein|nr:addiction module protein [Bacteroidota bacterium]